MQRARQGATPRISPKTRIKDVIRANGVSFAWYPARLRQGGGVSSLLSSGKTAGEVSRPAQSRSAGGAPP